MTRFTDLMYETSEVLREHAKILRQQRISVTASLLEIQAQKILEALADCRGDLLSTEDVERTLKPYDPSGSCYADVSALAASHETMRARLSTAESIAERFHRGDDRNTECTHWLLGNQIKSERMTPDQIAWFEAQRNKIAVLNAKTVGPFDDLETTDDAP